MDLQCPADSGAPHTISGANKAEPNVTPISAGQVALADAETGWALPTPAGAERLLPQRPSIAVIIPTLNEQANILPLVAALDRVLGAARCELIFVDDWSQDGTPETVLALARARRDVRLIRRYGRRGLASAVIEGMLATSADIVAVIDADMQHDERILPQMIAAVASGVADVAVGSRYGEGGSCGDWAAGRARASRWATGLARLALRDDVADPLSGFFALRRALAVDLVPRLEGRGYKILLDMLSAAPAPLKVREFAYEFRCRTAGDSKLDATVALDYLRLVAKRGLARLVRMRFAMFALVGLSGVAVNLGVLRAALGPLAFPQAQALAVAVAIATNFLLNNALTFRDRRLAGARLIGGLASFYLVCALGAAASVFAASLAYRAGAPWWLAGTGGAVVGAAWNFLVSSAVTWRRGRAAA